MNKKTVSIILLIIFLITTVLTVANVFLSDENTEINQTETLTVKNKTVNYEKAGKCLEVIDGNTIQVYGIGKVQLTQIGLTEGDASFAQAKDFVSEKCLGKTVYLDVDDKQPKDKYGRTLAIVYTNDTNVNKELLKNNLAKVSYFEPSEFEKGLD